MYDRLCDDITNFLLYKEPVSDDERLIYRIGVDVVISTSINISAILLLGYLVKDIPGAVFYLFCFMQIRNYCGGYHAKTRVGCLSAMCVCFLCAEYFSKLLVACKFFISLAGWIGLSVVMITIRPLIAAQICMTLVFVALLLIIRGGNH